MNEILTQSNITFALALIGILFGVYHFFRNPQIKSEKTDALLSQQMKWQIEGTERRFAEVQSSVKDAFALAQNHTHSVELKVGLLADQIASMSIALTRLETIISERIPQK